MVYAAFDPLLGRRVALKLLRFRSRSEGAWPRLLQEARALAKLSHPNVVQVLDLGTRGEQPFLAMEFLHGTTLHHWLMTERSCSEIIKIFLPIGEGLAAAHAEGIVHRDFKPSNVMVREDGSPCIVDFGLAAEMISPQEASQPFMESSVPEPRLPPSQQPGGTPGYLAPEIATGRFAGPQSDQYSFCVALHHALYGDFPSSPSDASQPTMPRGRVPGWLRRLLTRGLARNPEDRFPSMGALLENLAKGPRSISRRRATGLATAFVGGVALLMTVLQGTGESPTRSVSEVWNPERREAASRAFHSVAGDFGLDQWQRVETQLVGALDLWREVARAETSTQSQRRCLEDRLRELDTLLLVFEGADSVVVQRAIEATQGLTSAQGCLGLSDLPASTQDPELEESRRRVRGDLGKAGIFFSAGLVTEATDLACGAIAEAESLQDPGLLSESLYSCARHQLDLHREAEATRLLERTIRVSEAAGEDEIQARALSLAMFLAGHRRGEYERARVLENKARSIIQELGGPAELTAHLHHNLSAVRLRQNRLAEAKVHSEAALKSMDLNLGKDHPRTARALHGLAVIEILLDDEEAGLGHFTEASRRQRLHLGGSHPTLLTSQAYFGQALLISGRFHQGEKVFLDMLTTSEIDRLDSWRARTLLYLGEAQALRGRLSKARESIEKSLDLFKEAGETNSPHRTDALVALASVETISGRVERALELFEEAIERAHLEEPPRPAFLHYVLGLKGRALSLTNRAEKGWELLGESVRALFEGIDPSPIFAVQVLQLASLTALESDRFGEARRLADDAAGLLQESWPEHPWLAENLRLQGEAALGLGDRRKAALKLERSLAIQAQQDGDPLLRGQTLFALARIRRLAGRSVEANGLAQEALTYLDRVSEPAMAEPIEKIEAWRRNPTSDR